MLDEHEICYLYPQSVTSLVNTIITKAHACFLPCLCGDLCAMDHANAAMSGYS